jgi:hypothetical protein
MSQCLQTSSACGTSEAYNGTISVLPSQVIMAQGYCKAVGVTGTGGIRIDWLNSSSTLLSSTVSATTVTGTSGWTLCKVVGTAPASTAYARFAFYTTSCTAGYFQFDDCLMQLQSSSVDEVPDGNTYARPLSNSLKSGYPAMRTSRGVILALNPTHYYPLDNASLTDLGSAGATLTSVNGVSTSTSVIAPGDANCGASISGGALYGAAGSGFTSWSFAAWLQPWYGAFNSPSGILCKTSGAPTGGQPTSWEPVLWADASGYLHCSVWTGSSAATCQSASPINWALPHHVALTMSSATTIKMYVDGINVASMTVSGDSPGACTYWTLGAAYNNGNYAGLTSSSWNYASPGLNLQDAAIWEGTALSQSQVQQIYSAGGGASHNLDSIQDGSTYVRPAYINADHTVHVSTILNNQGSIIPAQAISYSVSVTQTTIGLSITGGTLLRADGSTFTYNASSVNYTGLTSGGSYYLYPYISLATGNLACANGNPPPTSVSTVYGLQMCGDGCCPITSGSINIITNGVGNGGGTHGGQCPEGNEIVQVRHTLDSEPVQIKASDVIAGDYILGYSFTQKQDVYRRVIHTTSQTMFAWRVIDGHKSSPCDQVYYNSQWSPAFRVAGSTLDTTKGIKAAITVEADSDNAHNFWLVAGTRLLIHNTNSSC